MLDTTDFFAASIVRANGSIQAGIQAGLAPVLLSTGHRLVIARNRSSGEVKYVLTNAPPTTGRSRVVVVGVRRGHVEHTGRLAERDVGLTHDAGRRYVGLMRHLVLCPVVLGFVALHTARRRVAIARIATAGTSYP